MSKVKIGIITRASKEFNEKTLTSTIDGMRTGVRLEGDIGNAIEEYRMEQTKRANREEDRFVAEQGNFVNDMKDHFDRNRPNDIRNNNNKIDTRDNDEESVR